jgi:hypothetical protein
VRRRRWIWGGAGVVAAIVAVVVVVVAIRGLTTPAPSPPPAAVHTVPLGSLGSLEPAPSPGPLSAENVPIPQVGVLAPQAASGQTVDGISCQGTEQTLFHVHTHLTIFVDGRQEQVPAGVGIVDPQATGSGSASFVGSGSCLYWLHTHAADGIIHIESPVRRTFTLGDFFDEWGQPLSSTQVGPAKGTVTALYNSGTGWVVYQGDPRSIPLGSDVQIQLEVAKPLVAPQTINWSDTGL